MTLKPHTVIETLDVLTNLAAGNIENAQAHLAQLGGSVVNAPSEHLSVPGKQRESEGITL